MTWNILTTLHEAAAERHLTRQGHTTYVPRCIRASRTGRDKGRAVPLWKGYALLRAPVADWRAVLDTYGVQAVLCRAGSEMTPAEIGDADVLQIQAMEEPDGVIVLRHRSLPRLLRGTDVRFKIGSAWGGLHGVVAAITGEDVVEVDLKEYDRLVKDVPVEALEVVA